MEEARGQSDFSQNLCQRSDSAEVRRRLSKGGAHAHAHAHAHPLASPPAGITVLLSLTVFMLLVAEIMPATSDSVPLIGTKPHRQCS